MIWAMLALFILRYRKEIIPDRWESTPYPGLNYTPPKPKVPRLHIVR